MHRIKTVYELNTTHKQHERNKQSRDPFTLNQNRTTNHDRLSDNGTLDTFLHRVRLEMLNTNEYKQRKQDNLSRKERIALMQNPHM